MPHARRSLTFGLLAFGFSGAGATAATLEVGPNATYKQPSEAIAAAVEGDVVNIAPGQYFDCAIVRQNALTIQGSGPGVVMTDKTCGGKALLVEQGNHIVIRNLTLQRARVPDGNGAGIRFEGGNLTVDNVKFINNQNGILGADSPDGTVRISNSEFLQNGVCERACAHGLYLGHMALVHIEHTRFFETKQGHHIKSRARRTEVIGCDIADGEKGTSSYLVEVPNGGSLIVRDSQLEKGPRSDNRAYAISIGAEGVDQPTEQILLQRNRFTNDTGGQTTFVRNLTATPAELEGNQFVGKVRPFEGDGVSK